MLPLPMMHEWVIATLRQLEEPKSSQHDQVGVHMANVTYSVSHDLYNIRAGLRLESIRFF